MLELLNTPAYHQFIGDKNVRTIKEAEANIQTRIDSYKANEFGLWLVELRETNTPIGTCGLIKRNSYKEIDIGFAFHPSFYGKGYAYEAAKATLAYGFEKFHFAKIVAYTDENNRASIALLEKLGLQFVEKIQFSENEETLFFFIKKPN